MNLFEKIILLAYISDLLDIQQATSIRILSIIERQVDPIMMDSFQLTGLLLVLLVLISYLFFFRE